MNVYTHVAMEDLATDVESLPPVLGGPNTKAQPAAVPRSRPAKQDAGRPRILAGNWDSLPEHVRQAIATLAGA